MNLHREKEAERLLKRREEFNREMKRLNRLTDRIFIAAMAFVLVAPFAFYWLVSLWK